MESNISRPPGTPPAQLDQYAFAELARLPRTARRVMIEDWLENIYGNATSPAMVSSKEAARIEETHGSDKRPQRSSIRDNSVGEEGILASRPPTQTERSACDVDTEFVERKTYQWRKWATESV